MGTVRTLLLYSVALGALGLPTTAFAGANTCSARVEGSPAGDFDITCEKDAEIRIDDGFLILPPECNFDGANDPTNPSNIVFSNSSFSFFKIGLANDGIGGPWNWELSAERSTDTTLYVCDPGHEDRS